MDEFVAVDTYLYVKDGLDPPSPAEIRAAYLKFIPLEQRDGLFGKKKPASRPNPTNAPMVLATDSPQEIIQKMACWACHQIPYIPGAHSGIIGPLLISARTSPLRLTSDQYQADKKAGRAKATTPEEYVRDAILDPNHHVVPPFGIPGNSAMSKNYREKIHPEALDTLVGFLLSLDCEDAISRGLLGPPQESTSELCGVDKGTITQTELEKDCLGPMDLYREESEE